MTDEQRIVNLFLDERTVLRRSPQVEHERKVAIFDLLDENKFAPVGDFDGPYILRLSIEEDRLVFDIHDQADQPLTRFTMGLTPFRRIVKDYFLISDSYYESIKTQSLSRIEAIDMGRRGLHNEGADLLGERLAGKVAMDTDTARRLFTLICVLHIRGR